MDEQGEELVHQMQRIEYNILCDIDDFCKENQITYFLSGGTCLGAVRHQGFIPWDEDVDIMLPREDYEKLILNFEKSYVNKYKVGSLETDKNWIRTYARIWDINTELISTKIADVKMGIYVDVFPIDGLPEKSISQNWFFFLLKVRSTLKNAAARTDFYDHENHRLIKRVLTLVAKPIGSRAYAEKINKMVKKHTFAQSNYVGAVLALQNEHFGTKEKLEKKDMEKGIRVPFEAKEFPIPIGYDRYLTNLYGDYMALPAESDRVHAHLEGWRIKIFYNGESNWDADFKNKI